MDAALLEQKLRELRAQSPDAFSHPKAREGEIWLGDVLIDIVAMQVAIYQEKGLKSARYHSEDVLHKVRVECGHPAKSELGDFTHRPVFANARELVKLEYQYQQQKANSR
jgi:hypothetical protein